LGSSSLSLYRLSCAIGYGYVSYWTVLNFKPQSFSLYSGFISQLKFLTYDTTLLQAIYFAFALILMPTNFRRLKSSLSALALTTSIMVSAMFWVFMYLDSGLIFKKEEFAVYPSWHMHVTHSLVTVTALFDVLLGRPSSLPFLKSSLLPILFYGSYVAYTEFIIKTMNIHAYPFFKSLGQHGRFQLYGCVAIALVFVHCVAALVIKLTSVSEKPKKTKKGKKTNNQQQQQQQNPPKSKSEVKKQKQKKHD